MPLNLETMDLINSVIQTDEDQAAFEAGYELAKNPDAQVTFGGAVDGRWGGVHANIRLEDETGTWLHNRYLQRGAGSVLVEDAPFVLGSFIAVLETKLAETKV